jgi:hypothetical protein
MLQGPASWTLLKVEKKSCDPECSTSIHVAAVRREKRKEIL